MSDADLDCAGADRQTSVLVVSAPSGTGKSTILHRLVERLGQIRFSISHTTRNPRVGERDGVQYYFSTREAFDVEIRTGRFLEWAEVHGNLYGTSRDEYERAEHDGLDLLLDLDVQGARQVRAQIPDALTVFILPPSYQVLEARLRGRAADPDSAIRRRLSRALGEARLYGEYDHVLVNDKIESCVDQLCGILQAGRSRTRYVDRRARAILKTFPVAEEG